VLSWTDALHIGQRRNQTDGPVTAHAQVPDVIKEDDTGGACGIKRIAKQSSHHDVGTPRLIDYGRAETIVLGAKALQPVGKRPSAEVWATIHY